MIIIDNLFFSHWFIFLLPKEKKRMEKLALRSSSTQAKIIGTIVSISGAMLVVLDRGPTILSTTSSSAPLVLSLVVLYRGPTILSNYYVQRLYSTTTCRATVIYICTSMFHGKTKFECLETKTWYWIGCNYILGQISKNTS